VRLLFVLIQEQYTYLIAAVKRSEQARLLNFVRLADYLITDGLRMVLTNTLEELLHEIRNVNEVQRHSLSMTELDPSMEEGDGSQESRVEGEPQPEEPELTASDDIEATPMENLVPSIQYFIVELHIKDEILTFEPSYQNYATQVWSSTHSLIIICK